MPIENPIMQQIGGPVGSAAPLQIDMGGFDSAVSHATEVGSNLLVQSRVDDYKDKVDAEEAAYQEELYNLIKERDGASAADPQDVLAGQSLTTTDPRAAQLYAALQAETAAHEQGLISQQRLGVRKEAIFREYAAKYPRLIPDFLKVSNSSGLGGTSSLATQEMVDYLNDGAVQAKADAKAQAASAAKERDKIEKNSWKLGIEPAPPNATPQQTIDWLEKYYAAADLHEGYKRDSERFAIWNNNNTKSKELTNQRTNSIMTTYGAVHVQNARAIFQNGVGRLADTRNISKLSEAANSVNLERAKADTIQEYEAYKIEQQQRMGTGGMVSASDWKAHWANTDAYFYGLMENVGTKEFAEIAKALESVTITATNNNVGINNIQVAKVLAGLKGPASAALNTQLGDQIARDARNVVTLSNSGATGKGFAPVVNPDGGVNLHGVNVIDAAKMDKRTKSPQEQSKVAGDLLAVDVASLTSLEPVDPVVIRGAAAQLASTSIALANQMAESARARTPFAPSDNLMATSVKGMASPAYKKELDTYAPHERQYILEASIKLLEQEFAYNANMAGKAFGSEESTTRSEIGLLYTVGSALGGGPQAPPDPNAGKELYEIGTSGGVVTLRAREGTTNTPAERARAIARINQFNTKYGPRLSTTMKALRNLELVGSDEEALAYMTSVEGFPQHLIPKPPEPAAKSPAKR